MLDILQYRAWALERSFLNRIAPVVLKRLSNGQSLDILQGEQLEYNEESAPEFGLRMGVKTSWDRDSGLMVTTSDDKRTIAILPILGSLSKRGDLCSYGMRDYQGMIQRMNDSDNISGMVLEMDTPGGTADGTPELAKAIKESKKPIVTFGDTMVASAGMWLASQSSFIIANANNPTEFGSIGTLFVYENWSAWIEKEIGSIEIIRAPQSVDKAKLNPIEEMPDDVREDLNEELKELTNDFITSVGKGRSLNVTTGKSGKQILSGEENLTTGRMYSAKMALQYGLIDAIGTFKDAVNKASELGAPKPTGNSNSSTNSNQISNMKIMQWLGFSQETEDKLSAEEKQSLASAEEKLTRMESENAVLKEQLQNANELTGDLKAEAKTKDAKIAELETKLAETPAVDKPATTEDKDPEIKEEDESQKAIDELPHNKELDSNPMFQGTETELKKN